MADFELDIPMPETYKALLIKIIDMVRKGGVLAFTGLEQHGGVVSYNLISAESSEKCQCPGYPLQYFCVMDLLIQDSPSRYFVLPKALRWRDYQKKSRFMKFLARRPSLIRDAMLGFSFVVSLAVALLELFNLIAKLLVH